MPAKKNASSNRPLVFVDAFAGCGGLSLGLLQAGLDGLFAVEHDKFAFDTLRSNLIKATARYRYSWPEWLPRTPIAIDALLAKHRARLADLEGTIDVLVGGPPCQGFSSAGRRKHDDPRNELFTSYLGLVDLLKPKAVLIENVRGFTIDFDAGASVRNFAQRLRQKLAKNYVVHERLLKLSSFGVPQERTRYFLLALSPGMLQDDPFDRLEARLPSYLRGIGLQVPVPSRSAISDLEVSRNGCRPSRDTPGFEDICYKSARTHFQRLMRDGATTSTDLRLARHSEEVASRFEEIIELSHAEGRLNISISNDVRAQYGLKKRALRVLDPDRPSPTITSMPDDLLHYSEPRTLTVRENARLQTFPDWFAFKGKYTTGGHLRRREVPRFTQVANAVPPLVARAIGEMLIDLFKENRQRARQTLASRPLKRDQQQPELVA